MADLIHRCVQCGSTVPAGAANCPVCDAPIAAHAPPSPKAAPAVPLSGMAEREELERHLTKLRQWAIAAQSLQVQVPQLPSWAIEFASSGETPEAWREVLHGVERIAQQRILQALDAWAQQAQSRLRRLEAYSVDSRLEREEIDDALHAARSGDVTRALTAYQQVARVVALKERHLDQAREELEKLVSLLRDMRALDIPSPEEPQELAAELERELRRGRLAPLKQRLRELQAEAQGELKEILPALVERWGDVLVQNRNDGLRVDREAATLARAARALSRGNLEIAVRELRRLVNLRPSAGSPVAREEEEPPTGSSQTPGRPLPRNGDGEGPPR